MYIRDAFVPEKYKINQHVLVTVFLGSNNRICCSVIERKSVHVIKWNQAQNHYVYMLISQYLYRFGYTFLYQMLFKFGVE